MNNDYLKNLLTGPDVVKIARSLLGMSLCSAIDGVHTEGIIVETEAYCGTNDKACHAHLGKFTNRTKVMYEKGGTAYVYLCYGIHHLVNVVTNEKGIADAVLIRALMPTDGIDMMRKRVDKEKPIHQLCNGPGKLSKAMGINKVHNEMDLLHSSTLYIKPNVKEINEELIVGTTRIGIDYAEEDKYLNWRFYLKNNKAVSIY